MSAIIIDDKIVHYEVLGRGKPIIFLHGWVGSWRYWVQAMQSASTSYRAYALDLWGFGDTAKENRYYTLEQQAELIDQFMNAMGIGKVALVGHGLGAAVAMLYTTKHSFVVDRAMMIAMPAHGEELADRVGSTVPTELASRLLSQGINPQTIVSEAAKTDQAAISTSFEELQTINLIDLTSQMTTASLVVHGQKDPLIPPPDLGENGDLPPMFHHIVFEDSGHFPMLDHPSKFHRLMKDFLDLPSGESPRQLQLKEEWKRRVR